MRKHYLLLAEGVISVEFMTFLIYRIHLASESGFVRRHDDGDGGRVSAVNAGVFGRKKRKNVWIYFIHWPG